MERLGFRPASANYALGVLGAKHNSVDGTIQVPAELPAAATSLDEMLQRRPVNREHVERYKRELLALIEAFDPPQLVEDGSKDWQEENGFNHRDYNLPSTVRADGVMPGSSPASTTETMANPL
jgi:hypothetical protein